MIQTQQTNLDFLMAGNSLLRFKAVTDGICQSNADFKKFLFSGCFMQGYPCLQEMTGTVQFMALQQVFHLFCGSRTVK